MALVAGAICLARARWFGAEGREKLGGNVMNKSRHGGQESGSRLWLVVVVLIFVVCSIAFVRSICNNGRPIAIDEVSAVTQTNTVTEVVTNDASTEAVVSNLIAVAVPVTNVVAVEQPDTNVIEKQQPRKFSISVRPRLSSGGNNNNQ